MAIYSLFVDADINLREDDHGFQWPKHGATYFTTVEALFFIIICHRLVIFIFSIEEHTNFLISKRLPPPHTQVGCHLGSTVDCGDVNIEGLLTKHSYRVIVRYCSLSASKMQFTAIGRATTMLLISCLFTHTHLRFGFQ